MEDQADIALIAACQQGEPAACRRLFELYRERIYALCRHLAGNPQDAEDLAQESFVRAFGSIGAFRGESSFGTWLFRIAANCCLSELRRRPRHSAAVEPEAALPAGGPTPEEQLLRKELVQRAEAAVAALPENLRLLFVLGTQLGMPYRQIGQIAGCSEEAVKMRLHRARQQVRNALRPYLES